MYAFVHSGVAAVSAIFFICNILLKPKQNPHFKRKAGGCSKTVNESINSSVYLAEPYSPTSVQDRNRHKYLSRYAIRLDSFRRGFDALNCVFSPDTICCYADVKWWINQEILLFWGHLWQKKLRHIVQEGKNSRADGNQFYLFFIRIWLYSGYLALAAII